jgi:hypothetical protein
LLISELIETFITKTISFKEIFMFWRILVRTFPAFLLLSFTLSRTAFPSGACCSVSKGDSKKPSFSLAFSYARSHERFSEESYNFTQQALNLKGGYPITKNLFLQAYIGLPLSSKLSHQASEMQGNSGIIYGGGIGYLFPEFLKPVEFFASLNATRSHGFLNKMENGEKIDQTILLSEIQGILLAELDPLKNFSFYSGLRIYYGKNKLSDDLTGREISGDKEGNLSPLVGIRYAWLENLSLGAEAGLGHTRVLSVGTFFTF